jgi:hypothetical protein
MTFAAEANPLPVVDSGRDLHLQRPVLDHTAGTVALLAGMLDQLPRSVAGGTATGPNELAEDAPRDLPHTSAPGAGRTGPDRRVGLRSVAAAPVARHRDAERHLSLRPGRDLGEVDLDSGRDVRATPPASAAADPEEVVAEERREEIGQAAEVERARLEAAAS